MAITVVQTVAGSNSTTVVSYSFTVTSTGAGNLLVVHVSTQGSATEHVTKVDDGTNTFSHFGEHAATVGGLPTEVDVYYLLSSSSGKTTITVTYGVSNGAFKAAQFWEVSGFTTVATDGSQFLDGTAGTGTGFPITGAALTTTGAPGFLAAQAFPANSITQNPQIGNEFTSGGDDSTGIGFVSLAGSSVGTHTPVWNSDTSGQTFTSMIAGFKETAAVSAPFVTPIWDPIRKRWRVIEVTQDLNSTLLAPVVMPFTPVIYPEPLRAKRIPDPAPVNLANTLFQPPGPMPFRTDQYVIWRAPAKPLEPTTQNLYGTLLFQPAGTIPFRFDQPVIWRAPAWPRDFYAPDLLNTTLLNQGLQPLPCGDTQAQIRRWLRVESPYPDLLNTTLVPSGATPFTNATYEVPRRAKQPDPTYIFWFQEDDNLPFVAIDYTLPRVARRSIVEGNNEAFALLNQPVQAPFLNLEFSPTRQKARGVDFTNVSFPLQHPEASAVPFVPVWEKAPRRQVPLNPSFSNVAYAAFFAPVAAPFVPVDYTLPRIAPRRSKDWVDVSFALAHTVPGVPFVIQNHPVIPPKPAAITYTQRSFFLHPPPTFKPEWAANANQVLGPQQTQPETH